MRCSFRGWGAYIGAGVLYTGWGVSKRDGVLVFGMVCSYTGCGVSILDGMLKNRTVY